ncbi:PVC-type heme-binding CxxCH protein [Spirosoma sordidisoli]|uniref:C-type cytochrome n=1 Tax=Spirosoma sordidisoli TaxID=2502893 RepID=A0A4Q2UQM7_9BACT|nr:PVC-type heme-binding CxxCH protein [Spirosoma sordidisoli]RYC70111.1 c-type cytochrome [Spirosoma sordidisoli]
MKKIILNRSLALAVIIGAFVAFISSSFQPVLERKIELTKDAHIALIGNNLGSRLMNYGTFDTELHLRFPKQQLFIRNLCDGGDTPGFRPHSARNDPWAFAGAEKFQKEYAEPSDSEGNFPKPDEWLTNLKTDVVIAFFGYSESFAGVKGLPAFKAELEAFVVHTLAQQYNGKSAPQLALVSPIAFQDLSKKYDLPNGINENRNLALYTQAMADIAAKHKVLFLDVFTPTKQWFATGEELTIDGCQLTEKGYQKLTPLLVDGLFAAPAAPVDESRRQPLRQAVLEKDYCWHNDYKIPNGVHIYGRRYKPFGPDNYPDELEKLRQMTANRDTLIWSVANGKPYDLAKADARTKVLKPIETNYKLGESMRYLYGQEALDKFTIAPGFNIDLFASEKEFPDLANPSQLAFDDKGRLWVAVMPTYPHYRPGDPLPNDKLLILEDTDGDFKADKQTVFADKLHLPTGFELAPEGVYIAQGTNLKLYTDTNGDDRADKVEILLSGFDDHDSHHVIHAFCADPSGAIYMGEGIFLHSNVETPYGTVRATHGGFMRYNPNQKKLERIAQIPVTNPWGTAFDAWGQGFVEATSNPNVYWLNPGTLKPIYGYSSPPGKNLIEEQHRVRPTSGLEFVSSRHFPDEIQGDLLLNNTIGFLGTKMHQIVDDGTGFKAKHRMDLLRSSDPNFRPVDMEFAPDGSLYLADWHNVLIGHMQHNARDPLRDHVHGRIYRITYPSRPLVKPANVAGARIEELLDNLKLPEYRTRYRSKRALRSLDKNEVYSKLQRWVSQLTPADKAYEHHRLEALWVSWGINKLDATLLRALLQSPDARVRAAAVHVARFTGSQLPNQPQVFVQASTDKNGRVRMEALAASTWLDKGTAAVIQQHVAKRPMDDWLRITYNYIKKPSKDIKDSNLQKKVDKTSPLFAKGEALYNREGYCVTCHQPDGAGLESSGFPPLARSSWVTGNTDRLIKLVMHGLYGPIDVNGKKYPGNVPMTPYGGMMTDEELAAVLNYVRNSFGNVAPNLITPEKVKTIREETKTRKGFYTPQELLNQHPNEG